MAVLQSLPLELLHIIASYLDYQEFCSLASTGPWMRWQLLACDRYAAQRVKVISYPSVSFSPSSSSCGFLYGRFCRTERLRGDQGTWGILKSLRPFALPSYGMLTCGKSWIPASYEARLAKEGRTSNAAALLDVFNRRENLKNCQPYTVWIGGYCQDFIYRQGKLCSVNDSLIRILDAHRTTGTERVIDLGTLPCIERSSVEWKLNHFQEDTLSVIAVVDSVERHAFVLDVRQCISVPFKILMQYSIPRGVGCLILHDSKHFVVGVRRQKASQFRGWVFFHTRLIGSTPLVKLCVLGPFEPEDDIGSNLVLEIIDRYLWVMTSEVTRNPEGLDPTSFYGGCRCYLEKPKHQPEYFRFHRRQQKDGPVHDLWSDLSLFKNESNDHVIAETRKEWLHEYPGSCLRSFYSLLFRPTHTLSDGSGAPIPCAKLSCDSSGSQTPEIQNNNLEHDERDACLGHTVTQISADRLAPWTSTVHSRHQEELSQTYSFTLAQTLFRSYDTATCTSLDLIDLRSCQDQGPLDLRLRIGHKGQPTCLWPDPRLLAAEPALAKLFQPDAPSGRLRAAADERSLVFSACSDAGAPIVLVSFDARMHFARSEAILKHSEER